MVSTTLSVYINVALRSMLRLVLHQLVGYSDEVRFALCHDYA